MKNIYIMFLVSWVILEIKILTISDGCRSAIGAIIYDIE